MYCGKACTIVGDHAICNCHAGGEPGNLHPLLIEDPDEEEKEDDFVDPKEFMRLYYLKNPEPNVVAEPGSWDTWKNDTSSMIRFTPDRSQSGAWRTC